MAEGYRELEVYRKAYRLVLDVYRVTGGYPREERGGITDQMRRAAVSIPLNIAEGYAKRAQSQKEFVRFLYMAVGSANEMKVLIELSGDLGYLDEWDGMLSRYDEIGRMLSGLIRSVSGRLTSGPDT